MHAQAVSWKLSLTSKIHQLLTETEFELPRASHQRFEVQSQFGPRLTWSSLEWHSIFRTHGFSTLQNLTGIVPKTSCNCLQPCGLVAGTNQRTITSLSVHTQNQLRPDSTQIARLFLNEVVLGQAEALLLSQTE